MSALPRILERYNLKTLNDAQLINGLVSSEAAIAGVMSDAACLLAISRNHLQSSMLSSVRCLEKKNAKRPSR